MSRTERDKWDARYAKDDGPREPSPFLIALEPILPKHGRALDVAGGSGRHAIWLARRGLDVTLVDISEVGLELARARAGEAGVRIDTLSADLETEPLPAGPWDLILQFHFLYRPLFPRYPMLLAPGGLLVCVQPTRSNLERHSRPGREHLLEDGELPGLISGLEVVSYQEGWLDEGRHEARLVARRRLGVT